MGEQSHFNGSNVKHTIVCFETSVRAFQISMPLRVNGSVHFLTENRTLSYKARARRGARPDAFSKLKTHRTLDGKYLHVATILTMNNAGRHKRRTDC